MAKRWLGWLAVVAAGTGGVDRGRGHQRTPKTWRHKVKRSLESNKPSASPLCQGSSGTELKGKKKVGLSLQSTVTLHFQNRSPLPRSNMEKKNTSVAITSVGASNNRSADREEQGWVQSENGKCLGAVVLINASSKPKKEVLPRFQLCLQLFTLSDFCCLTALCNLLQTRAICKNNQVQMHEPFSL